MSATEVAKHVRKKLFQKIDARKSNFHFDVKLEPQNTFPQLPAPESAPTVLQSALKAKREKLFAGMWTAFGKIPLKVDDPPIWSKDYLANVDLATDEVSSRLNHRALPGQADIKLIWELSRWNELVRLAQLSYLSNDTESRERCLRYLEDWNSNNTPYHGWNWTSALESGMRLIQFTWIDALISARTDHDSLQKLAKLRQEILPAHVRFTWRYRSFGSSANNHLLGELAGLILSIVRWPTLGEFAQPLSVLRFLFEKEVLAQFSEDGGNREQALNYQLFSWEFCWQVVMALNAAAQPISDDVRRRLIAAAEFFIEVQVQSDLWDYGDSDSAFVTPLFSDETKATEEWHQWLRQKNSPALEYWLGASPLKNEGPQSGKKSSNFWKYYQQTGISVREADEWNLRFDVSPLGYLSTAAHGHLDALHLSVWYRGVALLIDPGTGAYYGDKKLRNWLASAEAHNGPVPIGARYPERLGPFLWSEHHKIPSFTADDSRASGTFQLSSHNITREIATIAGGISVADTCIARNGSAAPFSVRWQFAPETVIKRVDEKRFTATRQGVSIRIELSAEWAEVQLFAGNFEQSSLDGVVSQTFRITQRAPFLLACARPAITQACVYRTTFLAC